MSAEPPCGLMCILKTYITHYLSWNIRNRRGKPKYSCPGKRAGGNPKDNIGLPVPRDMVCSDDYAITSVLFGHNDLSGWLHPSRPRLAFLLDDLSETLEALPSTTSGTRARRSARGGLRKVSALKEGRMTT